MCVLAYTCKKTCLPSVEVEARGTGLVIGDLVTSTTCRVVVELRPDDIELDCVDYIQHVGIWEWALRSTCNTLPQETKLPYINRGPSSSDAVVE